MVTTPTDIPVYDFDFRRFFACSSRTSGLPGVARVGAIENYADFYQECLERDVRLINSPDQQRLTSFYRSGIRCLRERRRAVAGMILFRRPKK